MTNLAPISVSSILTDQVVENALTTIENRLTTLFKEIVYDPAKKKMSDTTFSLFKSLEDVQQSIEKADSIHEEDKAKILQILTNTRTSLNQPFVLSQEDKAAIASRLKQMKSIAKNDFGKKTPIYECVDNCCYLFKQNYFNAEERLIARKLFQFIINKGILPLMVMVQAESPKIQSYSSNPVLLEQTVQKVNHAKDIAINFNSHLQMIDSILLSKENAEKEKLEDIRSFIQLHQTALADVNPESIQNMENFSASIIQIQKEALSSEPLMPFVANLKTEKEEFDEHVRQLKLKDEQIKEFNNIFNKAQKQLCDLITTNKSHPAYAALIKLQAFTIEDVTMNVINNHLRQVMLRTIIPQL